MTRTFWAMSAALALGLGGCADSGSTAGALGISDGDPCDREWEAPLALTGSGQRVGNVSFSLDDAALVAVVTTHSGWELGDTYLGVGVDGAAPTWVVMNPEPWVTGWLTRVVIRHPLDPRVTCGSQLKIQVQVNVRQRGVPGHELASAVGPQDRGEWGWADFRPYCCPEERGCTLTQGYWKNHPGAWPVAGLMIGDHFYTQAQLLILLRTPVRGDASVALAHQLVAAELNVAAGASPIAAIADAQTWMSAHDGGGTLPFGIRSSSTAGRTATRLNDALARYNEGLAGPGHCDDRDCDRDVDEACDGPRDTL